MSNIYGGDEVNALVLDLGSCLCKAGYAGDDGPKAVFPSSVGVVQATHDANGMEIDGLTASKRKLYVGQLGVNYKRDHMEQGVHVGVLVGACQVVSPWSTSDDGYADWDAVEGLCDHAIRERLRSDPKDFAIMMAEANATPKPSRDRLVELLFEKLRVPAIFLAKNAVLSAFATARQTAVIVDAGYRSTTVAAVHDGYALTKTFAKSPFGGQALNTLMQKALEVKGVVLRPRYTFKRRELSPGEWKVEEVPTPLVTPSFKAYQVEALVSDIREALCKVNDVMFDEVANANLLTTSYELPDGTEIIVGSDRLKVPEVLFQPRLLSTFTLINPDTFTARPDGSVAAPLPEMVMEAITKCDVDVRKDMYQGVVLTGGLSLTGGLRDRLEKELTEQGPSGARFKVTMAANPTERRFSTWLGGSILASLGSFQQMWVSRKEYDEHGTVIVHRKAP
ncbi:actin family [Haematococcus lacustris]